MGHSLTAQRCPLALHKRWGWWAAARPGFCQSPSLRPQPWPGALPRLGVDQRKAASWRLMGVQMAKKPLLPCTWVRAAKRKAVVLPYLSAHLGTAAHGTEEAPLCHGGNGHGAGSAQV